MVYLGPAVFAFKLITFAYLPSFRYYQSTIDDSYIAAIGTASDPFPGLIVDALALNSHYHMQANNATVMCQDLAQPIRLTTPGTLSDHYGRVFYSGSGPCTWQIDEAGKVFISYIVVVSERDQDNVCIYEGLCSIDTCSVFPLLRVSLEGRAWGHRLLRISTLVQLCSCPMGLRRFCLFQTVTRLCFMLGQSV